MCILQTELGVYPNLAPEEIFDASDDPNYEGPALPPKYQTITLSRDWYIPGKALRKKRQHRASHGAISFTALSKKIASSWHASDDHIKLFCARVSDIGQMKYKAAMHEYKKENNTVDSIEASSSSSKQSSARKQKKSSKSSPAKKSKKVKKSLPTKKKSQEVVDAVSSSADIPEIVRPEAIAQMCTQVYPEVAPSSLPVEMSSCLSDIGLSQSMFQQVQPPDTVQQRASHDSNVGMVDIKDDDILRIWMNSEVGI